MSTFFQRFLALFSTPAHELPENSGQEPQQPGMPLASPAYLREFAQRLGLEVDDLSGAEQAELKRRLDDSMDFREDNYGRTYHEVYQLGHGYTLADATRVSGQISKICAEPAAQAYLDYRENATAAEALMAAGSLLQNDGEHAAAARLFNLAESRRHRSSRLGAALDGTQPLALTEAGRAGIGESRDGGIGIEELLQHNGTNADSAAATDPGQAISTDGAAAMDNTPSAGTSGSEQDGADRETPATVAIPLQKPAATGTAARPGKGKVEGGKSAK